MSYKSLSFSQHTGPYLQVDHFSRHQRFVIVKWGNNNNVRNERWVTSDESRYPQRSQFRALRLALHSTSDATSITTRAERGSNDTASTSIALNNGGKFFYPSSPSALNNERPRVFEIRPAFLACMVSGRSVTPTNDNRVYLEGSINLHKCNRAYCT